MPNAVMCLYNELKHSVLIQTDLQLEASELYNWKNAMDYNKNIHKIGPEKAYKLIKEHGSIDNLPFEKTVTNILNYVRGRELFREYKRLDVKVQYCGQPDFDLVSKFLTDHNVNVDLELMKNSFVKNTLEFVDR